LRTGSDLEVRAATLVTQACSSEEADTGSVVAVTGLASLFDFMRVSSLIERVEDNVPGRMLAFFPGEYTNNVYRSWMRAMASTTWPFPSLQLRALSPHD
jgi:hypothetical protein